MSNLLKKLKMKKGLKQQIAEEGNKRDPRILNYYDLKAEEKLTILLVPDTNGELWCKFRKHGPNLTVKNRQIRGIDHINCAHSSSGQECPACQQGFDLLDLAKETDDKSYKEEAKKWFARDYTLVQCIVLETPIQINEDPEGNQVKLFYLPYKVEEMIKQSVMEGVIDEEDLTTTPLIIKKTENKGGMASYEHSYFSRKSVDDETLEAFEDMVVEPFDFTDLDIVPKPTTTEEVEDWLKKAEPKYMKAAGMDGDDEDDEDEEEEETSVRSKARRSSKRDEDDEEEEEKPSRRSRKRDEDDEDEEEEEKPSRRKKSKSDDDEEEEEKPSKSDDDDDDDENLSPLQKRLKKLRK